MTSGQPAEGGRGDRAAFPLRGTLQRRTGLNPGGPLGRSAPLGRSGQLERGGRLERHTPINPVSDRRRRENRERAAMVASLWPEHPLCVVYELSHHHPGLVPPAVLDGCGRWADDVHEPLTRGRGGSITDPGSAVPPCRPCHGAVQLGPHWAYDLGLLKHSWDRPPGAPHDWRT